MGSKNAQRILVVPDIHAKKGDSLERLDRLRLASRILKPTKLVILGDVWDFESLCLHDSNTPEWNDRNLSEDIEAGCRAMDKLLHLAEEQNLKPQDVVFTEGNHEDRYTKWMRSDNRLRTSAFPKNARELYTNGRGKFLWYDFLRPANISGITFQHYFVSGVMGRPQGGTRPASNLLNSQMQSVVCGHTHVLDWATKTAATGRRISALVAGCFVDPDKPPAYAKASFHLWSNNVCVLHTNGHGEYDLEVISNRRL